MAITAPIIIGALVVGGATAFGVSKLSKESEQELKPPTPVQPEEELKKAGLSAIARRNRLRRQLGRQSTILGGALGGQPSILG